MLYISNLLKFCHRLLWASDPNSLILYNVIYTVIHLPTIRVSIRILKSTYKYQPSLATLKRRPLVNEVPATISGESFHILIRHDSNCYLELVILGTYSVAPRDICSDDILIFLWKNTDEHCLKGYKNANEH